MRVLRRHIITSEAQRRGRDAEARAVGRESSFITGGLRRFADLLVIQAIRVGDGVAFDAEFLLDDLLGMLQLELEPGIVVHGHHLRGQRDLRARQLLRFELQVGVQNRVASDVHSRIAHSASCAQVMDLPPIPM